MATWYCDFAGGSDANNGTTFAQRVTTITAGVASKYAAGDTIRVASSPAPADTGVQATWTRGSRIVTLASALTQKIWNGGDGAWTPSTNVTATTSATRKSTVGNSSSLAIAAAFTTGLVAYFPTTTLNLAAYQQVSFWINVNASLASGVLSVSLCSDVAGATPVNTMTLNFATVSGSSTLATLNQWVCVTLNSGGALGSSIKSIAINAISDPGTITLLVDNFSACVAPGAGCITLQSLIGKNYASNVDTWYAIGSIVGTTVTLDGSTMTRGDQATNTQGYAGATETVELYARETIKLPACTVANGVVNGTCEPAKTGTVTAAVTFSFGWDTTAMTSQSGETWFDGMGGGGNGLTIPSNINFIITDQKCSFVRFGTYGVAVIGLNANISVVSASHNNSTGIGTDTSGASTGGSATINAYYTNNNGCSASAQGLGFGDNKSPTLFNVLNSSGNQKQGAALTIGPSQGQLGSRAVGTTFSHNATSGCLLTGSGGTYIGCTFDNNVIDIIPTGSSSTGALGAFTGCTFAASPPMTAFPTSFDDSWIYTYNNGGVSGTHAAYTDGATIATAASRLGAGGSYSWQVTLNANTAQNRVSAVYPVRWTLNRGNPVYCKANQLVTWSVWVNGSANTVNAVLTVPGGQIAGVPTTITAAANTALAGQWQELSVTFTPTQEGDVYAYVYVYGSVLNTTCYIDETDTMPNSDAGVANILSTATYNFNGAAQTGTYVDPGTTNVKIGATYGAASGSTGTYDGSDRWSDPGVGSVLSGQTYKADSVSANRTGTLAVATATAVATAVWDEVLSTHTDKTKFGGFVQSLLTLAQWLGLK